MASNLLKELDLEKSREETKKVAAAKKREKRKAKKKEKQKGSTAEKTHESEEEEEQEEREEQATRGEPETKPEPIVKKPVKGPEVKKLLGVVLSDNKRSEVLPMDDGWQEVVGKQKKGPHGHPEVKRPTPEKPSTPLPMKPRSKTVTTMQEHEPKNPKPIRKEPATKPMIRVTSPSNRETVTSEYNPFASNILTASLVDALSKSMDDSKKNFAHVAKMNVPINPLPSSTGSSTNELSPPSSPSSFPQTTDSSKPLAPIGSHRPSSRNLSRSQSNLNPTAPEFHHVYTSYSQEPLSANVMNIARMIEQPTPLPPPQAQPSPLFYPSPVDSTPTTLQIAQFLASQGQLPSDPNQAAAVVASYYYNHILSRPASVPLPNYEPMVPYPENSFSLVDLSNSNYPTGPTLPRAIGSERKRPLHMTNTADPPRENGHSTDRVASLSPSLVSEPSVYLPSSFYSRDYLR